MVNIPVFNLKGEKKEKITLDSSVFGIEPNNPVIFDVVTATRRMATQGTHKVKTKDEVAGGGRKPWKQKGTGRARHGSIRSPQWRTGGVVFGPTTEKNYQVKLNKKVWNLGYRSVFSQKCKENALIVVDKMKIAEPKTRRIVAVVKNLGYSDKKILILSKKFNPVLSLATGNVPLIEYEEINQCNIIQIMHADYIVIDKESVMEVQNKLLNKTKENTK